MVTMVMVVVMVVMVAVMVMSIARRRVAVGLLAVVKVTLVPRRRLLLRRRVVRPLRWSLRRRVRLRVPCRNSTEKSDRIRSVTMGPSKLQPTERGSGAALPGEFMPTPRRVTTRSVVDGLEPRRRGSLTGELRSRKGLEKTGEMGGACLVEDRTPGPSGSSWRCRRLAVPRSDRFSSWCSSNLPLPRTGR